MHRDVKPGNILLTEGGSGKLSDFGIAKKLAVPSQTDADGTDLTEEGFVIGTPAYLSPERLSGRRATVESDVYAVGVVLFEALTGQKPTEADFSALPPALFDVVKRAMSPTAEERFPSAAAMAAALGAAMTAHAATASLATRPSGSVRPSFGASSPARGASRAVAPPQTVRRREVVSGRRRGAEISRPRTASTPRVRATRSLWMALVGCLLGLAAWSGSRFGSAVGFAQGQRHGTRAGTLHGRGKDRGTRGSITSPSTGGSTTSAGRGNRKASVTRPTVLATEAAAVRGAGHGHGSAEGSTEPAATARRPASPNSRPGAPRPPRPPGGAPPPAAPPRPHAPPPPAPPHPAPPHAPPHPPAGPPPGPHHHPGHPHPPGPPPGRGPAGVQG